MTVVSAVFLHFYAAAVTVGESWRVSHYWRTEDDPDPEGYTADMVVMALNAQWRLFEKRGVSDLGIFIDGCSLYQARSFNKKHRVAFAKALQSVSVW